MHLRPPCGVHTLHSALRSLYILSHGNTSGLFQLRLRALSPSEDLCSHVETNRGPGHRNQAAGSDLFKVHTTNLMKAVRLS